MATDTISLSAVRAELERAEADLRQRQEEVEELRAFVQGFEAMLRRMESPGASATAPSNGATEPAEAPEAPGKERTEDRAVRELEAAGKFLNTRELVERMVANGYTSEGTGKITDTVYSILSYAALKKKDSRLVRVNAKWGLKEWQK
jgi:hypothetical protein